MGTRNLVPRNSGEGGIGKITRAWATGVFDNLYFGGLRVSMDQNIRTTDSVEFLSGNFVSGLTLDGVDVRTLGGSISQIESGSAEFVFFSDVIDNDGVTNKNYNNTPNPNLYLSSVEVTSASNLKVEMQWDGPNGDYLGQASIEGQEIPLQNIQQLGEHTRRFIGFLDNINIEGKTQLSGEANGRSIILPITEAGGGPEAIEIRIDSIQNSTPKNGQNQGTSHLKQGDILNVYADFDTSDVDSIKVLESGLAEGINFTNYALTENSGIFTATIPITVSNIVNGSYGVSLQAVNAFGSTGKAVSSEVISNASGTRPVDQDYPIISINNPTSYNGRSDGLREGESTTFSNSISNWNSSTDSILYTPSQDVSINNPNSFESTKTVDYIQGIFNNSNNIEIFAVRSGNGATDRKNAIVKIANGPQITGASLSSIASSATSPHSIGSSELKAGDIVESEVFVDGKGSSMNDISLSVRNEGVSNGSQTSYSSSYSKTTLPDGSYKFTIPINVYGSIGSSTRDGSQPAAFIARNNFGTLSDKFTTLDTATLNNGSVPYLNLFGIDYPINQSALKNSESATINFEKNNVDTLYIDDASLGGAGELNFNNQNNFTNIEKQVATLTVRAISSTNIMYNGKAYSSGVQSSGTVTVEMTNESVHFGLCDDIQINFTGLGVSSTGSFNMSISGTTLIINCPFNYSSGKWYFPSIGQVMNFINSQAGLSATKSSSVNANKSGLEAPIGGGNAGGQTKALSAAPMLSSNGYALVKKEVFRLGGSYNISVNNFILSGTKTSNGITIERQDIVNIANAPLTLSINNLASKLPSSPSGTSYQFDLQSSQLMLNSPTLSLDSSQSNQSVLSVNSSGTEKTSNSYTITVSDSDTKGTFSWSVTSTNLAGITTTSISTNPNYTLAGFSSRTINASPNSLGAGLADIGTTVSNISNVTFENVSEGGTAPNGGTIYTYQSYSDGIQLDNSYDVNNKFTICNSSGLTDSDGSFVFNLDKLNRSANTSTLNPASFVISED